jgi:RNA polymerase sigma-70 factor (ECF subfamily)
MYRVATNAAITKQRGRKRRWSHETEADDEVLTQVAATISTEDVVDTRLDLQEVERALASLPAHYRVPVVLRDVYGFSMDEIGKQLGISETAAKVRVHRGRKRLREVVWPGVGDDDGEV